jgi:phospholipid transport system substrate-binding protein
MRLTLTLLFLATVSFAQNQGPVASISSKDKELQKLLAIQVKSPSNENQQKVKVLINQVFDFGELAKRSVPAAQWDKNKALQPRFVKAFRTVVENSSVKKLEVYRADSTKYSEPKISGNTAIVKATAFQGGKTSELVYKMFRSNNKEWKAWDLEIDGMSTLQTYKDQFKKILAKKTFAELVAQLEKKAAQ